MIIGRSIWPPDFIITAKSVLHGRTVMDKETMMYLCIAIGVALDVRRSEVYMGVD